MAVAHYDVFIENINPYNPEKQKKKKKSLIVIHKASLTSKPRKF